MLRISSAGDYALPWPAWDGLSETVGDLIATEECRGFVSVGSATDVLQQRRVVDVGRFGRIDCVCELHGHECGSRGLTRFEPHPGIGDERQTGQQVG